MKHLQKHCLKDLTTLGVGGVADNLYMPESQDELIALLRQLREEGIRPYILGNGSNLLIADSRIRKPVVATKHALSRYSISENGLVTAGASVDIRKLISDCAKRGLRAPVELLTIPASVGGAIYMNAGRTSMNVDISQSLIKVDVFDGKEIFTLSKDSCDFGHRTSLFHSRKDLVLLEATFQFPSVSAEEIASLRKLSIEQGADKCYRTRKSAGSVFKKFHPPIVRSLMGLRFGDAMFSQKTPNCILNMGDAKYYQVIALVRWAKLAHQLNRKSCLLEWEIWK